MVASISARKSIGAALVYFKHMAQDEYYTAEDEAEAEGEWEGRGAERLALEGQVSKHDFEAALNGLDPKTGAPLAQINNMTHAPGWDMTYSAPKSVSVMWALSSPTDRTKIETAHKSAVRVATRHLEDGHAFTRRGKGGRVHEPVAGLTIARFHHHTSRDLDPQLHTHAFIFNTAPRRDGTWGTIVSRDLYKAQKETGAVYREHLANSLEREGYAVERRGTGFRMKAIPHHVERAFSKRRQAIEQAAAKHGYRTPKGMELAALRTRQAKRPRERSALYKSWRSEAKALGFNLAKARQQAHTPPRQIAPKSQSRGKSATKALPSAHQLLGHIASLARASGSMPGIRINLRQKRADRDLEPER